MKPAIENFLNFVIQFFRVVQEGKKGIQNFQLIVFTITYLLSLIFLYIITVTLLKGLGPAFIIIPSLLFITLGVLIWSYLYLVFSIPARLAGAFDPLKNKVASGEIKDLDAFGRELITFLTGFFNFSFMDILHASVKTMDQAPMHSDLKLEHTLNWENLDQSASKQEGIISNGKCLLGERNCYAYTIPIHFNNAYLGFFTVYAAQPLGKLRKSFLLDLEENFIDDLLVRFTPIEKFT